MIPMMARIWIVRLVLMSSYSYCSASRIEQPLRSPYIIVYYGFRMWCSPCPGHAWYGRLCYFEKCCRLTYDPQPTP